MYWLPKKIVWLRHYTPHHPLCEGFYTTAGSIFNFKRGQQPPKASRGSFDNEEIVMFSSSNNGSFAATSLNFSFAM